MASITLHKFGILPDEEESHVFTFIFENPHKLEEVKSVESSEVSYAGLRWSVVVMRREEDNIGVYLKWKYHDGQSAAAVSCKTKYALCLVHRHDYALNKHFVSNQKFTNTQCMLGKSKYIQLYDLLDLAAGYLDDTGKRVVLELTISRASFRFERQIDISKRAKTRKNASGYYFDTENFVMYNHKWYLRVYPSKNNANGLPAVYLYLSTKQQEISIFVHFRLFVGSNATEMLTYNFGEGAKFDGFGKTLPDPVYNIEKLTHIVAGVDIEHIIITKDVLLNMHQQGKRGYSPHVYNRGYGYGNNSLTPSDAFQDPEGNHWKIEFSQELDNSRVCVKLDKGVHHYAQNRTKLLCWSSSVLSRDHTIARDVHMSGEPLIGYFSNFIDDKGYFMTFPMELAELEERNNHYADTNGDVFIRVNFLSLQTLPVGMRSIPKFDYQGKHLLRARRILQEKNRTLGEMKDMSASRASLSMLDDRVASENSSSSGQHQMYKSYDSLDALSNGDMMAGLEDAEQSKGFLSDVLKHLASTSSTAGIIDDSYAVTTRDVFNGAREDLSTESGVTISDESSMIIEARPSPVDMGKHKETVSTLVKVLERVPLTVTEVLEAGSLGTGTSTRSRVDIDLIIYSSDLPKDNQDKWVAPLLQAIQNTLHSACANPDPFYPLPQCTQFSTTPFALQFTCGEIDVDVTLSHDWEAESSVGLEPLFTTTCKQTTKRAIQWHAVASSRLRNKFLLEQPTEVKELIKVVKHWRNNTQWRKVTHRPNSYLITLLVIRAVQETRSYELKTVLQQMGTYIMATELSIQWTTYYNPDSYPVEFDPPSPLVRDPTNPGFNVADTLAYWGQFRTEYGQWLKGLGMRISAMLSL